ncbi:MAG: tyrosine-type recombinase/integrase, partial [Planctomycetota bacterium]|nr:tyrosine-type recombinase/integrase [Planctomycetota bacterium]
IRYSETIKDSAKMFKRDAESIRRAKQSKLDCRMVKPDKPKRITLADLAAHDREMIADRRYKTLLGYDHAVGHAIKVLGSKARADRISRGDVAKLKAKMRERDYRPATIDKTVRTLRAMWNRAKAEGFLADNPFAGNGVRWDPRDSRIFTAEEIDAMVDVASDDWWRLFIRVLATTGLRLNEALHLRWCDVDLDTASVKVCRHDAETFTVDGETYPLLPWSAKAKASYRTIPLPDQTAAGLGRYKAKADGSAYVFVDLGRLGAIDARLRAGTLRDDYLIVNTVWRRFKAIQSQAQALLAQRRGVAPKDVEWRLGCIHDLRDTFLTGIKGLPIDVLQRIAGHADIATTIKFYTTATERDDADVRAAVAASGLAGGPGPFAGPFEVSGVAAGAAAG